MGGYIFKVMGGQDKQGFPMKQGVLSDDRVKLMLGKGMTCCRGYGMRSGEKYRKSVRGCIINQNLSILHMVITKKGEKEIPGLTDATVPRRLGPKRASKIRKLFNLTKEGKKATTKAPKVQRLVTPVVLQRKRHRLSVKKQRQAKAKAGAAEYAKLLALRLKEQKEKRAEKISQRRSQRSSARSAEDN